MAHFLRARDRMSSIFPGGSCPITNASGFSTYSAWILSPSTGIKASTFRVKMARTRVGESLYVSGMYSLFEMIQSQTAFNRRSVVIADNAGGRRSRISCDGSEFREAIFFKCGRIWNNGSWGVAR